MQRTITISPPGSTCDTQPGVNIDACSWNLMIVTTPWPEYPWLVCATKGNDEPPSFDQYLRNGGVFYNGDYVGDGTAKPTPFQYGAWHFYSYPNFMDTSTWVVPDTDGNDLRKKYQKIRVVGKGTTTYLNASRLVDGGRIIAGQYGCAARYIDTMNPSSYDIPWDRIKKAIMDTFCVPEVSVRASDVQAAATHLHQVDVESEPHSHAVLGDVLSHTHRFNLPEHSHAMAHSHLATVEGSVTPSGTVEVPEHSHTYDVTHSHKMDHSHHIGAEQLSHKHQVVLQPHTHYVVGAHRHDIEPQQLSHSHGCTSDTPTKCTPRWEYAPETEETKLDLESGPAITSQTHTFTDASLNVNLTVKGVDLETGKYERVGDTSVHSSQTLPLKLDSIKIESEGRTASYSGYTGQSRQISATTGEYQSPGFDTVDATVAQTATCGPAIWDTPSATVKLAECRGLTEKPGVSVEPIRLIRNDETPDIPDWFISEPPNTENGLFYGDPKAVTWAARKGAYQVLRIEDTELHDCNTGAATFYDLANKENAIKPEEYSETFSLNTPGCGTWGVIYYRNISLAASVTIKSVQFTQGVVNPKGPFANLTPNQIDPDPIACDLVAAENKRLQHTYPADYNDLGKLMGEIFGVAKSVGRAVKGVAGALEGVPVVGGIAGSISSLLAGLGL